jgi:hypothetical protein
MTENLALVDASLIQIKISETFPLILTLFTLSTVKKGSLKTINENVKYLLIAFLCSNINKERYCYQDVTFMN